MFQMLRSSFFFFISLIWFVVSSRWADGASRIVKIIEVDQSGHGDFTTIQSAIDSVPDGNKEWIRIHINRGTYREKVRVPVTKENIFLQGEGPKWTTIEWGDYVEQWAPTTDTLSTATFTLSANNFMAQGIQFLNSYNVGTRNPTKRALAATIGGDKAALYNCSFRGVQDTLCDYLGHHYFSNCWIEGATDFIFGYAQSIYEQCTIYTVPADDKGTVGFITAQGGYDPKHPGGFVFKYCTVGGNGKTYLGRAYGGYSTVIFYKGLMSDVVVPRGWDPWEQSGHENQLTFAEDSCWGPGSSLANRVKWEKKLSLSELKGYTNKRFIDNEGWLLQLPSWV